MDFRYYIEILAAFIGILTLALGVVMVLSRRDKSEIWCFAGAIFSSGLWILSVYFSNISTDLAALVWWTKAASITALIYSVFFTIFAFSFRFGFLSWQVVTGLSLPGALNIIYIYTFDPANIYIMNPFEGFGYDRPVGGVLSSNFSAFLILFFVYYLVGLSILLWKSNQLSFRHRLQIKYISFGVSISIVAAVLFDIILPLYGIDYLYALGPACSLFLVTAVSYAIVQHNLLDIRVVFQRGLIYSVLFGLFILVYVSVISLAGILVQEITQAEIVLIAGITALAGIIGAKPLDRFFRRVTNKWFFKDRYDYPTALHELSEALNVAFELSNLREEVANRLKGIFHTSKALVMIEEGSSSEWEILIQIGNPHKPNGFLALGPKRSGDAYTDEDVRLLRTFANQLAIAMERATLVTKLKENAELLEQRVRERTEEVRSLQEKQSYLIENMSHELQMPLTVLKAELEELRAKGLLSNANVQFEKSIDDTSRHLYKLMKLAKMQSGVEALKFQEIDFSYLLEEIMEYLDVVCKDNNISVHLNIQPEIKVHGDIEALNDLVVNLMSNAIKYIAGAREIRVSLTQGEQVELEVADTGMGIDPNDLPFVFDRFFRSRAKSQLGTPSTGLGLAICRQIVESHAGKISVSSELGQGSIFKVTFPKYQLKP